MSNTVNSHGHVKPVLLRELRRHPAGMMTADLVPMVALPMARVSTRLSEMASDGRVVALQMPRREGNRWFSSEHIEHATAMASSIGARMVDYGRHKRTPVRATTIAQAKAPIPMRPGSDPVVTQCPNFVDRRYSVDVVAPVFSGLRPGQYPLATGSAIERAYGGGKK